MPFTPKIPRDEFIEAMVESDVPIITEREFGAVARLLENRWTIAGQYAIGPRAHVYEGSPDEDANGELVARRVFRLGGFIAESVRALALNRIHTGRAPEYLDLLTLGERSHITIFGRDFSRITNSLDAGSKFDYHFDARLVFEGDNVSPPVLTTREVGRIMQFDDYIDAHILNRNFSDEYVQMKEIGIGLAQDFCSSASRMSQSLAALAGL